MFLTDEFRSVYIEIKKRTPQKKGKVKVKLGYIIVRSKAN